MLQQQWLLILLALDLSQDVLLNQEEDVYPMELAQLQISKQLVLRIHLELIVFGIQHAKKKTCANAPITNNTHDLCTSYLATCTVKSGGGC